MSRTSLSPVLFAAALLTLCLALIYLVPLGSYPLMEPDEGRYCEIPREMIATGDYVTPRLDGVEYFEKPALSYWATVLSFKTFGENEFAGRFWAALTGLIGVAATGFLAASMYGRREGLLAATITATSLLYYGVASINILDMPLTAFLTLAFACFHRAAHGGTRHWYLPFYISMALAVLTKGLVGVLLPAAVLFFYIILTRQWRLFYEPLLYWQGLVVFFLLAVPWFVLVCRANRDFFDFFFAHEQFLRYFTKIHHRYEPVWFFLPLLVAGVFPWTGFLPSLCSRDGVVRRPGSPERKAHAAYLLCWALVILAFFSFSDSKLIPYIVPCIPPLAILIAASLGRSIDEGRWISASLTSTSILSGSFVVACLGYAFISDHVPTQTLLALGASLALPLLGGLGTAWFATMRQKMDEAVAALVLAALCFTMATNGVLRTVANERTALPVAQALHKILRPGDRLVNFQDYIQGLPFYLKTRVTLCEYKGELAFGSEHPSGQGWFWKSPELVKRWADNERLVLVLQTHNAGNLPPLTPSPVIHQEVGQYTILTNR